MKIVLIILILTALVVAGGAVQFWRKTAGLTAALGQEVTAGPSRDIPALMRAFAQKAGVTGAAPLTVELQQKAEMRLKPGQDWKPLTAEQTIAIRTPGFVWRATMPIGPIPAIRVNDSFVGGTGGLEVRILGGIPIAHATGPDVDEAEAMRYLAELPWSPDAILNNPSLQWREVDETRVAASLDGEVWVEFLFDETGDIAEIFAKGRLATDADGNPVRYDWKGAFSDYRQIGGRRIPVRAEVGYFYPDGYESYFRCEVTGYSVLGE